MTGKSPCRAIADWIKEFGSGLFTAITQKPIEFLTLVVASFTLVPLAWQLRSLNDTLESQAYNYIIAGLADLDKMDVENAELRQYFLRNVSLPNDGSDVKIRAIADAKLDFMDGFYSQEAHIKWDRYTKSAWENYFQTLLICSPVLRDTYCNYQNEYGSKLQNFVKQKYPGMCEGKPPPHSCEVH
jgi:hypothetical protein